MKKLLFLAVFFSLFLSGVVYAEQKSEPKNKLCILLFEQKIEFEGNNIQAIFASIPMDETIVKMVKTSKAGKGKSSIEVKYYCQGTLEFDRYNLFAREGLKEIFKGVKPPEIKEENSETPI